jgi:hypothetical protein
MLLRDGSYTSRGNPQPRSGYSATLDEIPAHYPQGSELR